MCSSLALSAEILGKQIKKKKLKPSDTMAFLSDVNHTVHNRQT